MLLKEQLTVMTLSAASARVVNSTCLWYCDLQTAAAAEEQDGAEELDKLLPVKKANHFCR